MLPCYYFTEFEDWKKKYEKNTNSWFMLGSGEKELVDGVTIHYYYCNRSGYFKNKGSGQRHLKTQGKSKINNYCTASLIVSKDKLTRCINVQVHSTHYGHKLSLGHLRIPDEECTAIAQQLRQGVDFQHILDKIRDNVGKQFQRLHLLTRKDINNIEQSYGLKGTQRHNDDATSVQILVEEMNTSESNPITLYKPQGVP